MAENILVNKNKTLLIIGKAKKNWAPKEIVLAYDEEEVKKNYKGGDLVEAYLRASEAGVTDIFLMNIQKDSDYFDILDALKDNDFAYVVFSSLYLSDTFHDVLDSHKRIHNFFAYFLGYISSSNNSTFIVTDKHASLYEDIDAYLDDMRSIKKTFLSHCSGRAKLNNIIFVMNNLKGNKFANVDLAASMVISDLNEYPHYPFNDTVFHIDPWDNPEDIAYFRDNVTRETTIENLVNLSQDTTPEKVVFIDRIIKALKREIDFQEFKGRFYSEYQKLLLNQKLDQYLSSLIGYTLRDYNIDSIEAFKDGPAAVQLVARLSLYPINCLEVCSLNLEIEL
nr:MAG TPA: hypothetical protein [Myoviridae sp. ctPCN11]